MKEAWNDGLAERRASALGVQMTCRAMSDVLLRASVKVGESLPADHGAYPHAWHYVNGMALQVATRQEVAALAEAAGMPKKDSVCFGELYYNEVPYIRGEHGSDQLPTKANLSADYSPYDGMMVDTAIQTVDEAMIDAIHAQNRR